MVDAVKPKRKYASTRRAGQAADTRDAVIGAAREQFIAVGWQGTTIAGVARAAGVSNETIYAVFGNKQVLLRAVMERSVRRTDPAVPLLEQAGPRAIAAAADQRAQIALFAEDITGVLGNVAQLMAVVRAAAATDTEVAELYRDLHDGRRRNLAFVAKALSDKGPLRDGINAEAATALLWRLASPELFLLMTDVEGLKAARYAEWLTGALVDGLLPAQ
jgi:AcrR family transcriptional regulator